MSAAPSREGASRASRVILYGYAAATLGPVLVFLAFLVGSLALSGAQVSPDGRPRYGAPVSFPLFVVPDWLSIGCAVVAAALLIPLLLTTSVANGGRLVGMVSYTAGAVIADGFFAFAFPRPDGLISSPSTPDVFLGHHIVGAAIGIVCALVLVIRVVATNAEYERLRAAGELTEEQL